MEVEEDMCNSTPPAVMRQGPQPPCWSMLKKKKKKKASIRGKFKLDPESQNRLLKMSMFHSNITYYINNKEDFKVNEQR